MIVDISTIRNHDQLDNAFFSWYTCVMQNTTQSTDSTPDIQVTMEAAFAELGPMSAEPVTLLKNFILMNEVKAAAEANLKTILAPAVELLRLSSIDLLHTSKDIRVIEYYTDGNSVRTGAKKVAFAGPFRGKKGEYKISHVQKDGQRSVKVADVEALIEALGEGHPLLESVKNLINPGSPSSHNLVTHTAGLGK